MKASHLLALLTAVPALAHAQQASFVYRLGKDTLGIEQYTRTANRLVGEAVSRNGTVLMRILYDASIAADGGVSSVAYRLLGGDGKPIKGRPVEIRYAISGDSAQRTVNWGDSTTTRTVAAKSGLAFAGAPAYGMLELAAATVRKGSGGPYPVLGLTTGAALPTMLLTAAAGDTIRQGNGLVFVVNREGQLQVVDGSATTGKLYATRGKGGLDLAAIAARLTPIGILSGRGSTRAHFVAGGLPGGVVMIDYGRPMVRDRTVWGGLLIPLDTIWRLGANEATHFATSRELAFGDAIVPPGLYTLFLYNAKSGPMLAINKQVGQWGTVYDQAKDLVRIPLTMSAAPEHVEEFTINIRQAAPNRGSIEISWGNQTATAGFVAH